MRLHAEHHVQVAWRPAPDARLAFAADTDLRAGVDARRYPHGEPARHGGPPLTSALRARAFQQPARSTAGGACGLRHDRAEDRLLGPADLTRAAAAWARLGAGPRLGATARAPIARRQARHVDLLFGACEGFLESDGHVVAEVVAPVRPLPPPAGADTAAEERVEDVGKRHVREVDRRPAPHVDGRVAEHVIAAAPARVGEHGVCLARLLEPSRGHGVVGVAVGVRLHRDLSESLLQVVGGRLPAATEDLVVVALYSHLPNFLRSGLVGRAVSVGARVTCKLWAPGELDERGSHDAIANPVAASQLGDDGVLGMLARLLMTDRLVQLGVEGRADRLDGLETVGPERILQLAHAQLDSPQPRLVDALGAVLERLVEVVQPGQEPGDQLRGRVLDGLELVLASALFEILEVGAQAQVPILGLGRRGLELGDLAFQGRDLLAGRRLLRLAAPLTFRLLVMRFVRVFTGRHDSSTNTALRPDLKPRAPPYGHWRCARPPAAARQSGCTPSSSARSHPVLP